MQEPAVSQKEFEAGLSLLHMMYRAPSMEDLKSLNAPISNTSRTNTTSSKASRTAGSFVMKTSSHLKKETSATVSAVTTKQEQDESEQEQEQEEEEEEEENDDSSNGGPGFLRRNVQLNSLSRELTIDELRAHFGKPIVEVAREFGICTTFLKKICRRCGIKRWPHRQIRSLTRTIDMLRQAEANTTNPQERMKFANQILQLEVKKQAVIEDPDANGKLERVKKCVISKAAAANGSTAAKRTIKKKPSPTPPPPAHQDEDQDMLEEGEDAMTPPRMIPSENSSASSPIASSSSIMSMDFYRHANIIKAPASSSNSTTGDRISPSNRKVLTFSKSNVEERKRSSSFSSSTRTMLQEEES